MVLRKEIINMKKILKWGLISFVAFPIVAITIIGAVGPHAENNSSNRSLSDSTPTTTFETDTIAQTPQPTPTVKTISYELLQQWDINNGGYGKTILIPTDYLNETDMTSLGQKLKEDTKNDKNSFISIFTNKEAAKLRDKLSNLSKTEEDFYDKNYVGQYTKNGNSGFHTFVIYFDGVSGTNSKTIKY
jgi:hypothetical protein